MVIGIVPNSSRAESLLNNLDEADFKPSTVSVVMNDVAQRNQIAKDTGPLKGVTLPKLSAKLVKLGLSSADAQAFTNAVQQGQVLVAIAAPQGSQQAAAEMLSDADATLTRTI